MSAFDCCSSGLCIGCRASWVCSFPTIWPLFGPLCVARRSSVAFSKSSMKVCALFQYKIDKWAGWFAQPAHLSLCYFWISAIGGLHLHGKASGLQPVLEIGSVWLLVSCRIPFASLQLLKLMKWWSFRDWNVLLEFFWDKGSAWHFNPSNSWKDVALYCLRLLPSGCETSIGGSSIVLIVAHSYVLRVRGFQPRLHPLVLSLQSSMGNRPVCTQCFTISFGYQWILSNLPILQSHSSVVLTVKIHQFPYTINTHNMTESGAL